MLGVNIRQDLDGVPDRQAVEMVRYRAGWDFALNRRAISSQEERSHAPRARENWRGQPEVIGEIFRYCGLWDKPSSRALPSAKVWVTNSSCGEYLAGCLRLIDSQRYRRSAPRRQGRGSIAARAMREGIAPSGPTA